MTQREKAIDKAIDKFEQSDAYKNMKSVDIIAECIRVCNLPASIKERVVMAWIYYCKTTGTKNVDL